MASLNFDVTARVRADLRFLEPYPAPLPLSEFARSVGVQPHEVLKLDQNENPYGCSPRVREALAEFDWFHVYPDPEQRVLRGRLSAYAGVPAEQIIVGNGSDELIELLLRLFLEPGDEVLGASPTFGYYETAVAAAGGSYVTVPRDASFGIDVPAMIGAVSERTKLVFLASPNNPTGNSTPLGAIRQLLGLDLIVVVDEAYFEFSGETAVGLFEEGFENLVVLRTFSKWAGLAGVRLGYGVFPRSLVPIALAVKPPYSVSQVAEVAGLASLDDLEYLRSTVRLIVAERSRLSDGLTALGILRPYPSDANFIFADVTRGSGAEIQKELEARAILIRRYASPPLDNGIRVSVGRPEQTDRLLAALTEIAAR